MGIIKILLARVITFGKPKKESEQNSSAKDSKDQL
jgi:hypothetical protein